MAEPIRGGVGRVAFELIDAFASGNPGIEIVCATTGSTTTELPRRLTGRPNVKRVHIKIPNKLWSLASMLGMVSFCAAVEKRCGPADAFFMPNLGFVGRLPKHVPSILLLHDLSFLIEPRWFSLKQRLWHRAVKATGLTRMATRLLAVSETTKNDATKLLDIPAERIGVIPLGSTLRDALLDPNYRPSTAISSTRYVLALGARDPRKNAATAVEAVRTLRLEIGHQDLELVLVGKPLDSARDDNRSWIRTVPHPTDTEIASLYSRAALFLYPSWYEGFGLPLHEAAAFGTPCVASTSGALPETAPPGTLFANPAKPHHWVEAMKMALDLPRTSLRIKIKSWDDAAQVLRQTLD